METDTVIAAVCQLQDRQGEPDRALRELLAAAAGAAEQGAQLVCAPEAFLCGYTRDPAIARGRAIGLQSPGFGAVCRALSRLPAVLILGLIEADGADLFNTAAVIGGGRLIGAYRKRHPIEDCFTPGDSLPVFTAGPVRFGIGICSDARSSEDATALARAGARAIFYPLNNLIDDEVAERWRDRHLPILRQRAREAGVWVLSADVVGRRPGAVGYGCTAVVDPAGRLTARVTECVPGTVLTRIGSAPDTMDRTALTKSSSGVAGAERAAGCCEGGLRSP